MVLPHAQLLTILLSWKCVLGCAFLLYLYKMSLVLRFQAGVVNQS